MARQINFNGYLIKQYGAYIRTRISGLQDINGVGSGVIGIVGMSERGPVGVPTRVTSYVELVEKFGDGPMVRHGLAMFIGGAFEVFCVRIGDPQSASLTAARIDPNAESKSYTVKAREKGTFGNYVSFAVYDEDLRGNDGNVSLNNKRFDDNIYRVVVRYADRSGNDIPEEFYFPRYIPLPRVQKSFMKPDGQLATKEFGRFYNRNTDRFFLLRDRTTGEIRNVPDSWTFASEIEDENQPGALTTLEQFVARMEELKSTSEDLLTFPAFQNNSNERTPYPISVIAHVINNGGFGYSPSQFVTLEDIEPDIEDLLPDVNNQLMPGEVSDTYSLAESLLTHAPLALSGGANGDDGSSFYLDRYAQYNIDYVPTLGNSLVDKGDALDYIASKAREEWTKGLKALEEEDINFVQLAYLFNQRAHGKKGTIWDERYGYFKSVMPLLLQHVNTQSNTPNRKFRTSIVGFPWFKSKDRQFRDSDMDFLEETREITGLINSDRIQLWAGGFKSRAFSTRVENYGAEMLASFIVGLHCSKEVQDSITFQQISGIFTDGLEFNWSSNAKNELYSRATDAVFRRKNITGAIEYIAAHNMTSWTGASNRGIPLFITRRIVDYMNTFVYKNIEENFIGRQSRGAETREMLSRYTTSLLGRLVQEGKLVAFANVRTENPELGNGEKDMTVYQIFYDFHPVSEIDFITIDNNLTYKLGG